jgi:soluble lytic murein transglycosylase-like protein
MIRIVSIALLSISIAINSFAEQDIIDELLPKIIKAESSGNPSASDGKSYGLMGISECVLKDFNNRIPNKKYFEICENSRASFSHWEAEKEDLFNPEINKYIGTWYLHWIQEQLPPKYKDSQAHLVFAYNFGIGKLKTYNYLIPLWTLKHKNKIYKTIYQEEYQRHKEYFKPQ